MSGGTPAEESTADGDLLEDGTPVESGVPVGPLLEHSRLDDGPLEVGINVSGTEPIDGIEFHAFLSRSRVDPGDRIELGIFVAGVGDLEETDLSVFYDDESPLDLEDPGLVRRNATASSDDVGDVESSVFRATPGSDESGLERRPLEGSWQDGPAYLLELNTRPDAPAGTYPLRVVFTYRSEDGLKQVKRSPTVRLRSRRERWQPWVVRAVAGVAALGGLAAILQWSGALF
ncbi:hypothetical protein [Halopiger goleimassiliensis]|uniref:hypothetical protein n=1 Tax=Halopiger goleimassiliensis TaxID=1293048 RepID=UPI0012B5C84B|nr:hypothetical protein [Halopiger goleimassiliensis]